MLQSKMDGLAYFTMYILSWTMGFGCGNEEALEKNGRG